MFISRLNHNYNFGFAQSQNQVNDLPMKPFLNLTQMAETVNLGENEV